MAVPAENSGSRGSPTSAGTFGFVWTAGIVLSFVSLRLAISGKLWNLGFPSWMITVIVLVGIWQWIGIVPMLGLARRLNRHALYNGLLRGGISFSALHLAACLVLYFTFRKVSLQ
jgi:hypothetical protein